VDALRAGDEAILKLTHAGQAVFDGITLAGSSRALGFALDACATNAPPPTPSATALNAAEIRSEILGRRLYWGDDDNGVGTVYLPGGRFEGMMVNDGHGRASNGRYAVMADGRLCWEGSGVSGCFRFERRGGDIVVRRDDARSQAELGVLQVTP
jgi:hypothetical protein